MKIALINDTHFGCRGDNAFFLGQAVEYFQQQFFPYLKNHGITKVIHAGDLVDRRKYINFNSLHKMNLVLKELNDIVDEAHFIVGNHDVFYKDTNEINSFDNLLASYDKFKWYTRPTEIDIGTKIALFPWICDDNREESMEFLKNTKAQVAIGHFEIQGFEMAKGYYCEHGMDKSIFDKFNLVLSGHFHHKSSYNNINYLGTQYQWTWDDYGSVKGFHVLDTETLSLEYISNPNKVFHKIIYNDMNKKEMKDVFGVDFSEYVKEFENKYVKLFISNKSNPYWFEIFVEELEKVNPQKLQILQENISLEVENAQEITQIDDTLTLLLSYCKSIEIREDCREKLDSILHELYTQANLIEI